MKIRRTLFLALCCLMALNVVAKIRLAAPFADGMVMQQQSKVKVWGTASPLSRVSITTSWSKARVETTAGIKGQWKVFLETPVGSYKEHVLTVTDGKETLTLRHLLIGEVWLACGQSNMEMPLEGWGRFPVEHASELVALADEMKGKLRLATVPKQPAFVPTDTTTLRWLDCNKTTAAGFSAIGYLFGRQLSGTLHVPVGVICSSYSGTPIECWTPKEQLEGYTPQELTKESLMEWIPSARPMVMYNGMIRPIEGYQVKGVLWYQGEANVSGYNRYAHKLTRLITSWRGRWGQEGMPFLCVELAPYVYTGVARNRSARLREAQWAVSQTVDKVYMISTTDLVKDEERSVIHPSNKQGVAERLCEMALGKVYGQKQRKTEYPMFEKIQLQGPQAVLSFKNAATGFSQSVGIEGFEACGDDNIFYPCKAAAKGNTITVRSDKVKNIKWVHYCFKDFQPGRLKNKEGLPLVPFRTEK